MPEMFCVSAANVACASVCIDSVNVLTERACKRACVRAYVRSVRADDKALWSVPCQRGQAASSQPPTKRHKTRRDKQVEKINELYGHEEIGPNQIVSSSSIYTYVYSYSNE